MSRLTCLSLFSGGGGSDLGAQAAGFLPIGAVEFDADIAQCYADNLGAHVVCKPIAEVSPKPYEGVDLLMASPPCQAHSVARSKTLAPRSDADAGLDVIRWLRALRPRWFLLENVPPYQHAATFKAIVAELFTLGYFVHWGILNSADFGVPQTRRRLILRATRDGLIPSLPVPVKPWRGWYEAIADLLPTLPESKFADWQLARLPAELTTLLFAATSNADSWGDNTRPADEPAFTTTENANGRMRAFPVTSNTSKGNPHECVIRTPDETAPSVCGSSAWSRAFLVDGQETNPGANGGERTVSLRNADEPALTLPASVAKGVPRAWLETGRVVSMTARALARFQTFPDSYKLPARASLACKVIGNALPCLLAEVLCRGFVEAGR